MFAVIAGLCLAVAAIAFSRRRVIDWVADEFTVGYNLLATQLPSQNR